MNPGPESTTINPNPQAPNPNPKPETLNNKVKGRSRLPQTRAGRRNLHRSHVPRTEGLVFEAFLPSDLGFRGEGLGLRVSGLGLRGFGVLGLGFRL